MQDDEAQEELSRAIGKLRADRIRDMHEKELKRARELRSQLLENRMPEDNAHEEPLDGSNGQPAASKPEKPQTGNEEASVYEEDTSTENALKTVTLRREETFLQNQQQNLALRKRIANVAMWAVGIQMALANLLFAKYMCAVSFQPEPVVMISWMTSTVVQIVGIAMVVTRNLFPSRNGDSKKDEERDL